MKKLITVVGILVLVGAVAIPVMAWGPGWGWGHHMMGYWGSGPEYGRGDYGNLTAEQRSKLDTLERKFYEETRDLRDQIWTKSSDLDAVVNSPNPDLEKAKGLQGEISELRANLDEKSLNYELEARKIAPDQQLGYDRHMGTYGRMMGSGRGYCWD